ncbi:hypothetical protein IAR50_003171 [Cryptococcus sp. DSM 104548]
MRRTSILRGRSERNEDMPLPACDSGSGGQVVVNAGMEGGIFVSFDSDSPYDSCISTRYTSSAGTSTSDVIRILPPAPATNTRPTDSVPPFPCDVSPLFLLDKDKDKEKTARHPPLPLRLAPSTGTSMREQSWIEFRSPSSPTPSRSAVRPPNTTSPSWSHPPRERDSTWSGIRRALSLTHRPRPKSPAPRAQSPRDAKEGVSGRAYDGPGAEMDGVMALGRFPAPPGHAGGVLGPPLLLLPSASDGGSEEEMPCTPPESARSGGCASPSGRTMDPWDTPYHHRKHPSVPRSYTNSSLSRHSRYTAFSHSSADIEGDGTSIYSSSTLASSRGHPACLASDKPDISTVFEEPEYASTAQERGLRYPRLQSQASSNTLVSRTPTHTSAPAPASAPVSVSAPGPNNYFSRERDSGKAHSSHGSTHGTIATFTSTKSSLSAGAHPFANAVVRPSTPTNATKGNGNSTNATNNATFRSPQPPLRVTTFSNLSSSKSAPNLDLPSPQQDEEPDALCPVCVEPMGATYRLPGEKPPIVPECGHALHEECFSHVYRSIPPEGSRRILGVCGVCRQPMQLADAPTKKDKLAMLMGQKNGPSTRAPPASIRSTSSGGGGSGGYTTQSSYASHSSVPTPGSGPGPGQVSRRDTFTDDPISRPTPTTSSSSSGDAQQPQTQTKVIVPHLSIKSEFPTIPNPKGNKAGGRKETVTCLVTVSVPAPRVGERARYPAQARVRGGGEQNHGLGLGLGMEERRSPQLPPSPTSSRSLHPTHSPSPYPYTSSPAPNSPADPSPFTHIFNDLKTRIIDHKYLNPSSLGQLKLFDILSVRKDSMKRDFHVYLCTEALVCCAEEKRGGFRGMFSREGGGEGGSTRSDHSGQSSKNTVLRLKGRIYLRHVTAIIDLSTPQELALNISMGESQPDDSFVLTFRERASFETWKGTLGRMMDEAKGNLRAGAGGRGAGKILGPGVPMSPYSPFTPSTFSPGTISPSHPPDLTPNLAPGSSSSPLAELAYTTPLAPIHTPLDLVLVLSLSACRDGQPLPLKTKLVRQSVEFALALLGPHDRVSLVSCEMGSNGALRKTPFLSPYLPGSRARLEGFVETLGQGRFEDEDEEGEEFTVPVGRDEKLDVVTAINTALDVVLQRKSKNPLSGMIIISETADGLRKAQMDLVTARLDAAHIPVHAVGYGRGHDPSPLWIVTSHTQGEYTFVKEWYDLRETLAGVVGGMMSVAMDNVKLHISCLENDFRVVKVVGPVGGVVVGSGKEVDVELQELHYGQKREILLELEVEGAERARYSEGSSESGSGYFGDRQSSLRRAPSSNLGGVGMDMLSVADSAYEEAVEEVPVCEVDLAYRDPSVSRSVARLAHPQLLTIAIAPPPPSHSNPSHATGRSIAGPLSQRDHPADPAIVARRLELLSGDMITRAVLLASRKNFVQAERITKEMSKIVRTMQANIRNHFAAELGERGAGAGGRGRGTKREREAMAAVDRLEGPAESLEILMDGILGAGDKGSLDRDVRDHSAQQSSIMRSQRAWTTRTLLEADHCVPEVQGIIQLCGEWQSRF